MSNKVFIDPKEIPPQVGEPWWIVHPNNGNVVFRAPVGAITVCTNSFRSFRTGIAYTIASNNELKGHITIQCEEEIVEMPYYIFARHFDAEAFVTPISPPTLTVRGEPFRFEG